jgi:hypothetical protein
MSALSRRTLLGALLVALAAFAASAAPAFAQATAFSSVAVDVSRLRAIGAGPAASLVQAAMTDELQRVFADRIVGRGPRLVVRVTALFITAFPGGRPQSNGATDSIDGEALVVGPRGQVLAAYPQFAALAASGSTLDGDNERRRVVAVSRFYAQWLRRKIS